MLPHFLRRLADKAERAARCRFRNQPVKIWRVVRNEPDAHRVRRHVFRQRNDRLNQRNRFLLRPTGGLRHAARRAVAAYDRLRIHFFARSVGCAFDFDDEP